MSKNQKLKAASRTRRKYHIRKKIFGTASRPRLSVFRSARHIYGQLIDDENHTTLASASSIEKGVEVTGGNKTGAHHIGKVLGQRAIEKGITTVIFDRNGFLYHGRVQSLADGAREAGLKF